MPAMRRAWWKRARLFFLLYILIIVIGIFANRFDVVITGWKTGLVIFASAAFVGTAGLYRVLRGQSHLGLVFYRLESVGFGGMIAMCIVIAIYSLYFAATMHYPALIAWSATYAALAVALLIAYRGRPVRTRTISDG